MNQQKIIALAIASALSATAAAETKSVWTITEGHQAEAVGVSATAVGTNAKASGNSALAAGSNTSAVGDATTAVGHLATVKGNLGTAVGTHSQAAAMGSAFGSGAQSTGESSTAVGKGTRAPGKASSAFGAHATASGVSSLAGGLHANASGGQSTALGQSTVASGEKSTAIGSGAQAVATASTAIGMNAKANNAMDVALGARSTTETAVGTKYATVKGLDKEITFGSFAGAVPTGTVSVGSAGAERTITNVAAGRINAESTDAVNGSQLFTVADLSAKTAEGLVNTMEAVVALDQRVTTNTTNIANNTTAISNQATQISNIDKRVASNATQIANHDKRIDSNAKQIATNAKNIASNANQIANNAKQIANVDNRVTALKTEYILPMKQQVETNTANIAKNETAIGNLSQTVSAHEDAIIGLGQDVQHLQSTVETHDFQIGELNTITNDHTVLINRNIASIDQLGKDVKAAKTEVVAGNNTVVTSTTGVNGQTIYTVGTAKDVAFDSVSVGNVVVNQNGINAGGQKVTNVAAGEVSATSTDAINGSQLYAVNEQVNTNTGNIADIQKRLDNVSLFSENVQRQINGLSRDTSAAAATGIAHASLVQAYEAGQSSVSVAGGHYHGEQAVVVGGSHMFGNGKWGVKGGVSYNTRKHLGVGIGVGYFWGGAKPAPVVQKEVVREVIVREVEADTGKKIRG